jgi:lysine-N-methylase
VYAEKFRCIGPACDDNCCSQDWRVDIDRPTWDKYQTLPAGSLRTRIDASIHLAPESAQAEDPDHFAQLLISPTHPCPMLSHERLCQIQVELGEGYLSKVCVTYPRRTLTIDNIHESPLSLSCPEAARLVLLDPSLMEAYDAHSSYYQWDDSQKILRPLKYYLWPLREFAVHLIRNRSYPLWQRMFLLGSFSRRLSLIVRSELDRSIPTLLRDFSAAVNAGALRPSMETIPADPALQFDFLLRLVVQRLARVSQNSRLIETLDAFVCGVGFEPESTLVEQIANYAAAYERYFAPFFLKNQHILENYLLNMIYYNRYPLGAKAAPESLPDPEKEFEELTILFVLIKGLLIGVAGHYKEKFATEHVIQTVQTAFKHFEHDREFMAEARVLLAGRKLNDMRGFAMLLRN